MKNSKKIKTLLKEVNDGITYWLAQPNECSHTDRVLERLCDTMETIKKLHNERFEINTSDDTVLDKVIEVEDYNGNTICAIMIDKDGKIVRYNDCEIADVCEDYIFESDKDNIRLQKITEE